MEANTLNLPVLALRGLTVFPHTNLTFDVERRISIKALEVAMESGQEIFLVTQRELNTDRPGEKDLYTMGTISRVTQILRLGKNSLRVMVEGGRRARLRRLWQTEPYLQGHVEVVEESAAVSHGPKTEALLRQTWGLFQDYAHLAGNVAEEVTAAVLDCQEPGYLADFIAQNTALRYDDKQAILEELSPLVRLRKLNGFLARERDVLGYERQMEGKVRDELAQKQKEQILRTQIRVLQNELGEDEFIKMMRFVDWLWYSDEGLTLTKWGKEGETYTVTDGTYSLTPGYYCKGLSIGQTSDDQVDLREELGYACGNFMYGGNTELLTSNFTEDLRDFYDRQGQYRKLRPLDPAVTFDEDQMEMLNLWGTPMTDTVNAWTCKFAMNQAEINNDWDTYVAEVEAQNMQNIVDMYNDTYNANK